MAAAGANATFLAQEAVFYGRSPEPPRHALGAEEYFARIQHQRVAREDDATSVGRLTAGFREEAWEWWSSTVPVVHERTIPDITKVTFKLAAELFQKQYFRCKGLADPNLNWMHAKQVQGERASAFLERVLAAAHTYFKFHAAKTPAVSFTPADYIDKVATGSKAEGFILHHEQMRDNNDHKAGCVDWATVVGAAVSYRQTRDIEDNMVLRAVLMGLHTEKFKDILRTAIDDKKELADVIHLLNRATTQQDSGRNPKSAATHVSAAGRNGGNGGHVGGSKGKGKGKGKNKNKKKKSVHATHNGEGEEDNDASDNNDDGPAVSAAGNGLSCTFCDKSGHEEAHCFARIRARRKYQEDQAKKSSEN